MSGVFSSKRLPFFVTTGLDPAVHAEIKHAILDRWLFSMDARIKSGHNEIAPSLSVSPD